MIKKIVVEKVIDEYFCDICNNWAYRLYTCGLCKMETCSRCNIIIDDCPDYPEYHCKDCHDIYKKYQPAKKALKHEYDLKFNTIKNEMMWKIEAIEKEMMGEIDARKNERKINKTSD